MNGKDIIVFVASHISSFDRVKQLRLMLDSCRQQTILPSLIVAILHVEKNYINDQELRIMFAGTSLEEPMLIFTDTPLNQFVALKRGVQIFDNLNNDNVYALFTDDCDLWNINRIKWFYEQLESNFQGVMSIEICHHREEECTDLHEMDLPVQINYALDKCSCLQFKEYKRGNLDDYLHYTNFCVPMDHLIQYYDNMSDDILNHPHSDLQICRFLLCKISDLALVKPIDKWLYFWRDSKRNYDYKQNPSNMREKMFIDRSVHLFPCEGIQELRPDQIPVYKHFAAKFEQWIILWKIVTLRTRVEEEYSQWLYGEKSGRQNHERQNHKRQNHERQNSEHDNSNLSEWEFREYEEMIPYMEKFWSHFKDSYEQEFPTP